MFYLEIYKEEDKWPKILRNSLNTSGSNKEMTNVPLNYFCVCSVNIL